MESINNCIGQDVTEIGTKRSLKILESVYYQLDSELIDKIRKVCSLIATNKDDFIHHRNTLAKLLYN